MRAQWGCDVPCTARIAAFRFRGETIDLYQCPSQAVSVQVAEALSFYPWLTYGCWPAPGAALDQSATFVAAMQAFSGEVSRLEHEEFKKHEREAKDRGSRR